MSRVALKSQNNFNTRQVLVRVQLGQGGRAGVRGGGAAGRDRQAGARSRVDGLQERQGGAGPRAQELRGSRQRRFRFVVADVSRNCFFMNSKLFGL